MRPSTAPRQAPPAPGAEPRPRAPQAPAIDPAQDPVVRDRGLGPLAIGAPIGAAFLGLLIADRIVFGGDDAGASAAQSAQGEGGIDVDAASTAAGLQAGMATAGTVGASTAAGGDLDPGKLTAIEGAGLEPRGGAAGQQAPAGEADSVASTGATTVLEGANVSLQIGELDGWPGLDGQEPAAGGLEERPGPIGAWLEAGDEGGTIHGTDRDDVLIGGAGDDVIHGGAGNDLIFGGGGDNVLHGGPGDDILRGGPGDDLLFGDDGDDILFGGAGDDRLFGGAGDDILYGGSGNDHLEGGAGADLLFGGWGDNTLVHDDVHDVAIQTGRGPDGGGENTYVAGPGLSEGLPGGATFLFSANLDQPLPSDVHGHTHQVGANIQHLTLEGDADHHAVGDGNANVIHGNQGNNVIYGMGGDDILYGVAGSNRLYGGEGNDILYGGSGDDILFGGPGNDILHGGAGNNLLYGGPGNNLLVAGTGDDLFLFARGDHGTATVNVDQGGVNRAQLDGFDGANVQAALVGGDLWVVVDFAPLFVVQGFESNPGAFAGIQVGESWHGIDDLLV